MKRKSRPRKNPPRQIVPGRQHATGFNGIHILLAIVTLLGLLLAAAVTASIFDKPQAAPAWDLVHDLFMPTLSALLTALMLAARQRK